MSTIRSPKIGTYQRGQLASIPCTEADPFPDWAAITESDAHDMRSIYLDGEAIAAFGYVPVNRYEMDAFAVIDRSASMGVGPEVAKLIRAQMVDWIHHLGVRRVNASCSAQDRVAQVFLRAIGFRKSRTTADTAHFTFIWR